MIKKNKSLVVGGLLSVLASLLHLVIVLGGPEWYRFFGAGEGMAQLAEDGSSHPALITASIALILGIWALYAFSGAGIIRRLPLLKPILFVITGVYMLRGILGVPLVLYLNHPYLNELAEKMMFMVFSSMVSLSIGLFYLRGLTQTWSTKIKLQTTSYSKEE
jgi:hypothetical protein